MYSYVLLFVCFLSFPHGLGLWIMSHEQTLMNVNKCLNPVHFTAPTPLAASSVSVHLGNSYWVMGNLAPDWRGCQIRVPITIAITMLNSPLGETTSNCSTITGTPQISTAPSQSIGTAEYLSPGLEGTLEKLVLKAMRQEMPDV